MFKVTTLYSPLKLFFPVATAFFLTGIGYYSYTYFTMTRFTNMSALLLTAAVVILMMGLISEQITALNFRDSDRRASDAPFRGNRCARSPKADLHYHLSQ